MNLLPNGDDDGGLLVLPGAHNISVEFHEQFKDEEQLYRWTNETYFFTDAGMKWLDTKGFKWVKVNADPGDLIICESEHLSPAMLIIGGLAPASL